MLMLMLVMANVNWSKEPPRHLPTTREPQSTGTTFNYSNTTVVAILKPRITEKDLHLVAFHFTVMSHHATSPQPLPPSGCFEELTDSKEEKQLFEKFE